MTPTSVYVVSPRWDPAFVWHLVRATSTPPAPISKPVGSQSPRLVGPLIPPLSRKWRSGSKSWLPPTPRHPHLYQPQAPLHPHPPPTQPDPRPVALRPYLLYHPYLPHTYPPSYHSYPNSTLTLACTPLPPPPPHSLPLLLYTTLPRRILTSTGQGNP